MKNMKKVPIKELREDLKEELKEELVPDSEILDKQRMGEEMYHKLEIRRDVKDSHRKPICISVFCRSRK